MPENDLNPGRLIAKRCEPTFLEWKEGDPVRVEPIHDPPGESLDITSGAEVKEAAAYAATLLATYKKFASCELAYIGVTTTGELELKVTNGSEKFSLEKGQVIALNPNDYTFHNLRLLNEDADKPC